MAEFWWGNSPKAEIRHHGYYYPACKGKCEPILKHMLQGLDVEPNPLSNDLHKKTTLEVLFEDEQLLVVNKPAGMLSVPGKGEINSVYQHLRTQYPDATGPMIVHRLDMATSGVLLVAKTKETHQNLQAQFKNRTVKKRYIALLDGIIAPDEGILNLPICPDPLDPILENRSTALVKLSMVLSASPCSIPSRTQCLMWPSSTTLPQP